MAALGLPPIQSKFVQSLDLLADATIVATIRGVEDAEGQIILVRPILEDGKITWTCGAPDENLWKYLPPMCRHKMEPNKQ
jgi:hypothetical protein